ncbi:MAG: adenylate/guanylate cyclase domain-containing protein, partial [Solirubrobacterales bacterium]|nr:adenylate/guanylate cyclase domain-containing protein [Solirubrobacterales bacterium]
MTSNEMLTSRKRWTPHGRRDRHGALERIVPLRRTERKLATVLFVDVYGSMDLSAAMELEAWWLMLSELFELMCEGVHRFGGWIANFTGDGIKGVFEGPDGAEVHARQACQAALWLRHALRAPSSALLHERGLELRVRIGINSGEVLMGTIGGRYGRCYIASGYAVALAKRIESLARPGRVYVTEHTAALVADALKLQDLGAFDV